jgi:serine phosphatase RsbU (regulator of sigma subunit)
MVAGEGMIGEMAVKEYLSSLRYAGLIQNALMPQPEVMESALKEYFLFFRPRDYVSGDFYYLFRGRHFLCVAAGDCTGHGVPGALLSILGLGFLNEILQCLPHPRANRVLNSMRERMMNALHQTGVSDGTRDSIDMGLCIFDSTAGKMQYSGANRPLFIAGRDGLREIKSDKMPIGVAPLQEEPFTNHIVEFGPDDTFVLFSDGYPDQFGGPSNKKFKYNKLRAMLGSIANLDACGQCEVVKSCFDEWIGEQPQIDDVMVLGFKPKITG